MTWRVHFSTSCSLVLQTASKRNVSMPRATRVEYFLDSVPAPLQSQTLQVSWVACRVGLLSMVTRVPGSDALFNFFFFSSPTRHWANLKQRVELLYLLLTFSNEIPCEAVWGQYQNQKFYLFEHSTEVKDHFNHFLTPKKFTFNPPKNIFHGLLPPPISEYQSRNHRFYYVNICSKFSFLEICIYFINETNLAVKNLCQVRGPYMLSVFWFILLMLHQTPVLYWNFHWKVLFFTLLIYLFSFSLFFPKPFAFWI